jgi:hypothetical protein
VSVELGLQRLLVFLALWTVSLRLRSKMSVGAGGAVGFHRNVSEPFCDADERLLHALSFPQTAAACQLRKGSVPCVVVQCADKTPSPKVIPKTRVFASGTRDLASIATAVVIKRHPTVPGTLERKAESPWYRRFLCLPLTRIHRLPGEKSCSGC